MNKLSFLIGGSLALMFSLGISKKLNAETLIYLHYEGRTTFAPIKYDKIQQKVAENSEQLERQAQQLYENGDFAAAIVILEQLINYYASQGDLINQLFASRNLALVYTKTGNFEKSEEIIDDVINQVGKISNKKLLAQSLDIKGQIQLSRGQTEEALESWQQAAKIYQKLDDSHGLIQSQINQVQALQALGLYNQATQTIDTIIQKLESEPDTLLKAKALQTLGDVLRQTGDLENSRLILLQSLAIAEQFSSRQTIAGIYLSLGNTANYQKDYTSALDWYQKAMEKSVSDLVKIQAKINQFSIIKEQNPSQDIAVLISEIKESFKYLSPSRATIYAQINFALSLMGIENTQSLVTNQLTTIIIEARKLGDKRAESYGLGSLGNLYEKSQRWQEAKELTQKALLIAQGMNAGDLAYQWQWQLGRIIKLQGGKEARQQAIAAYTQSVKNLQSLRRDLLVANPEIQFEFRESVEPVYRELVDLLLQEPISSPENLLQARDTIESLQVAELENFFREICLVAKQPIDRVIDNPNSQTAVIYPIILPDRIEIIVKLPQQSLRRYTTYIPQTEVEQTLTNLRQNLSKPYTFKETQALSNQVYHWLLQPLERDLQQSKIETLVFVLDGSLRNIPMSVLYDGQQYLIQKYSIALAPGLQLVDPKPLQRGQLHTLAAGLSESRLGFAPLRFVKQELEAIQASASGKIILDREFTETNFNKELNGSTFAIVHLATHGQFSSKADDTFILAWDEPIKVKELDRLLRSREPSKNRTIELLVLSACQTAAGDRQSALGLAGVAVKSGARSVLASLWNLDDESTALFMSQFYQELANTNVTKAEALRKAQLSLLQNPRYQHPRYWAPYVLVGNWL